MKDAPFRLALLLCGSALVCGAGRARGGSCADLEARLSALNKRDDSAAAARLQVGGCAERLPHLLLLKGWALLRLAYQQQVAGEVDPAATAARQSVSLLEKYLTHAPNLDAQARVDTNTFISWAQALLRLQEHLRERRFAAAEEVQQQVQQSGQQSQYKRDDALTLLRAQILLQRAQSRLPSRWQVGRAAAAAAGQARAEAMRAATLCENLPLKAQIRFREQRDVCAQRARALEHSAGEVIRLRRHRQLQIAGTTALVLGLTGLAALAAGGVFYGVDGHQSCTKADLGHCAYAWDTQGIGTVLLGVGGGLAGVGLVTWGIARGLDARQTPAGERGALLVWSGRF